MLKVARFVLGLIKKHIKTCVVLLMLSIWFGYRFYYNRAFPYDTGEYVPYVFGQLIDFSEKGNSDSFVKESDGWGNQERKYRCTVSKNVFLRYYVKNDGQAVKLKVRASGSFPYPDDYQRVIIAINGTDYSHWKVSSKDWYEVVIPASMITDNKLEIRFNMTKPYTPKGDTRKLGMIVEKIKLEKIYGQQTRVKLRELFVKLVAKYLGEDPIDSIKIKD